MQKQTVTFFESIMLLVGSVVGAGILGIPYAVSKVGFGLGVGMIIVLGLTVLFLHLMLGEVIVRTKKTLQIGGLVGYYISPTAGRVMQGLMVLMCMSALVAYVIGMGESLFAIFGDMGLGFTALVWGIVSWCVGAIVVIRGIRAVAHMELIFASLVFLVILLLGMLSVPHITATHLTSVDWKYLFLPYGIILFAFHGSAAIPTVEELLPHAQRRMKRAIIISGLIALFLYIFFTWTVVGVLGGATTPIATIGLGDALGSPAILFGNLFALFAMLTCFFSIGFSLRRTLEWDVRLPGRLTLCLALFIPLLIVLLGMRNFIGTIGLAGTLFGSIEALFICRMYWRAQTQGDTPARSYALHAGSWFVALVAMVFLVGGLYGIFKIL